MQQLDNRVAGPLYDLASHVPAEWWRTLFGPLYLRTDGDVVENDRITAQEVDVLVAAAALSERHRILDLCCGQPPRARAGPARVRARHRPRSFELSRAARSPAGGRRGAAGRVPRG